MINNTTGVFEVQNNILQILQICGKKLILYDLCQVRRTSEISKRHLTNFWQISPDNQIPARSFYTIHGEILHDLCQVQQTSEMLKRQWIIFWQISSDNQIPACSFDILIHGEDRLILLYTVQYKSAMQVLAVYLTAVILRLTVHRIDMNILYWSLRFCSQLVSTCPPLSVVSECQYSPYVDLSSNIVRPGPKFLLYNFIIKSGFYAGLWLNYESPVIYIASNMSTRCLVLPCRICLRVLYLSRPWATLPSCSLSFFVTRVWSLEAANSALRVWKYTNTTLAHHYI